MFNQFTGIGNLAADPDHRVTANSEVANFTVCCESGYGEHKRTEYVKCVAWSKLAGIVRDYLHKGSKVMIQGTMETRKWTDQSGIVKYSTEIRLDVMRMLSPRPDSAGGSAGGQSGNGNQGGQSQNFQGPPDMAGEIPF